MFVALEGIDGSGKTSVSEALASKLREEGYSVFHTREPTPLIRPLLADDGSRRDPFMLFLLFTADRQYHQQILKTALRDNDFVICDRYLLSSYAYQGTLIADILGSWEEAAGWMDSVSRFIELKPDLTVFLDVSPAISMKRIAGRGGEKHSYFEKEEYLEKVREAYMKLLSGNYVSVDSSGQIEGVIEEAHSSILEFLKSRSVH